MASTTRVNPATDELGVMSVRRLAISMASVMVPFTPEVVPEGDIDGGTVTVEPPPGMLEEGA